MCLWRLFKNIMQNPRNFQFSSDYPIPYFIYKKTIQIDIPARGDYAGTATKVVKHNLNCQPLPVGYWSTDSNFSSTNPIGADIPGEDQKKIDVIATRDDFVISGSNDSSSQITLYVRLCAYVAPDDNCSPNLVSDSTAYYFDTDYKYLEIFKAGHEQGEGNAENMEIKHNLGYIPQCAVWWKTSYNGVPGYTIKQSYIFVGSEFEYNNGSWVDSEKLHLGGGEFYYHIYINEG